MNFSGKALTANGEWANCVAGDDWAYCVVKEEAQIADYSGFGGTVAIPETLGGFPVTGICSLVFPENKSVSSIVIPEGVRKVGVLAFYRCSALESITIPSSVNHIEKGAFPVSKCLSAIHISDDNPAYSVQDGVLYSKDTSRLIRCPVSTTGVFVVPDCVTEIESFAFAHCASITEIIIHERVREIGAQAFHGCGVLAIRVAEENSVFSDSDGILMNKDKTRLVRYPGGRTGPVVFPDSMTEIGEWAFSGSLTLTSVDIPEGMTEIGWAVFRECELFKNITIPNSVTKIGNDAFYGCKSLESITIPDSVTEFGGAAFRDCSENLTLWVGTDSAAKALAEITYIQLRIREVG